jgi:hypothetical protein
MAWLLPMNEVPIYGDELPELPILNEKTETHIPCLVFRMYVAS